VEVPVSNIEGVGLVPAFGARSWWWQHAGTESGLRFRVLRVYPHFRYLEYRSARGTRPYRYPNPVVGVVQRSQWRVECIRGCLC